MCFFSGLVAIARAKHPIPSRSRKLSAAAAMVLRLKTWESSSPPNLTRNTKPLKTTHKKTNAGWSSQVARQAHNLKVTGSNPVPATKLSKHTRDLRPASSGAFACALFRGSTVEARGSEKLRTRARPLSSADRRRGDPITCYRHRLWANSSSGCCHRASCNSLS